MGRAKANIIYISQGDIPSKWAHSMQAMHMAEALAQCGGPLELLSARAWIQPGLGMSVSRWYGLNESFSIRRLPTSLFRRDALMTDHADERFENAAARHAISQKPRLVYARSPSAAAQCALAGVSTILESHMRPNNPGFEKIQSAFAAKAFLGIVTVNSYLKDQLVAAGVPEEKVYVWPDAVSLDAFSGLPSREAVRASLGLPQGPIALYAGHLYKAKGIEYILGTAAELPETSFVIVGGWEDDIARCNAQAAGLPNVHFAGFVPHGDIPRWLAAADVLLLPNRGDSVQAETTSPLKLFEYMAARRPIVASDIPALRGLLRDEGNALLFTPGRTQEMAAAITRLQNDEVLAARLVEAAWSDVQEYTWKRRAEDILRHFGQESLT